MESSKDKRTKALLQPQVSLKQYVVYMKEDANCLTYRCSAGKKTQQNKRTKTNKKPLPKPNNNAPLTPPSCNYSRIRKFASHSKFSEILREK